MGKQKNVEPMLLRPAGKDYLWGGERLKTAFHKAIDLTPLAETWECSTHTDGQSAIADGPYAGRTLADYLAEHPEALGSRYAASGHLPILVKLIDAAKDLSVQVHPDDAYAALHEHGALGKTECWVVLEAAPGARLVYGFSHAVTPEEVRQAIQSGTLEDLLRFVPVRAGDVFLIRAGTVHAIGAGIVVAEIQQNSNLTYRLYDYNRSDQQGNLRPLHIDKALSVARLTPEALSTGEPTDGALVRCPYFTVRKLSFLDRAQPVSSCEDTFAVLLVTAGEGTLAGDFGALSVAKGDCVFIPANAGELMLSGVEALLITS